MYFNASNASLSISCRSESSNVSLVDLVYLTQNLLIDVTKGQISDRPNKKFSYSKISVISSS